LARPVDEKTHHDVAEDDVFLEIHSTILHPLNDCVVNVVESTRQSRITQFQIVSECSQWRRQLVGTWARAPWRSRENFFSLGTMPNS